MRRAVTDKWWPLSFGCSSDEIRQMNHDKSYNPEDILNSDPQIREAMDLLKSGDLADNEVEDGVLKAIYNSLLTGYERDRYFVLKDLRGYYDTQKKAEALYADPHKWAEVAIHNIASMGEFSSDESVRHYAEKIWDIKPVPIDGDELHRIRKEFLESDRCYLS